MKISFETYTEICDLLNAIDENGEFLYSVEEIASLMNVSVETVEYVNRAENE